MPRNGPERPFPPICVHSCVPTRLLAQSSCRNSVHKCPETAPRGHFSQSVYTLASPHDYSHNPRVATVYTNAPKRPRGAISTDLCTLLRRRPGGEAHVARAVTQPPTHTNSRSLSNEVDFVVGWGEDIIGIEVKSGRVRSTGGLTAFLLRFPGARTLVIGSPACTVGSFLLGAWPLLGLSTSRGPPPSLCGCSTGPSLGTHVS